MYVRYGLLADGIVPGADGKKNIIGTFNTIFAANFPARFAQNIYVLIRLEGHDSEAGEHELTVDIVNETGERIVTPPYTQKFSFDRNRTTTGTPLTREVVVEIEGLAFISAGNYDFAIRVDGRYLDSVPIYVRQSEQSGG